MTTRLRLLDRIAVALAGLLMMAAAIAVLRWHNHPQAKSSSASAPHWLLESLQSTWWTWALSGASLMLVVLAGWWLCAHLPRPTSVLARLPGTGHDGQLSCDLKTVADTAADVLSAEGAIASARAKIEREYGRAVLEITATTTPHDLPAASDAATSVHVQLGAVLDSVPVPVRTLLRVKAPRKARARVH